MTVDTEIREYGLFIDGGFVEADSAAKLEAISPSTAQPWARVPDANAADVDRAVASAKRALKGEWGNLLGRERGALMLRFADLIEARGEELAALEVRDNGKTIREMRGQYAVLPHWFRYFASLADKLEGRVLPHDRPSVHNYTLTEPVGVVGAITPWNSPGLQLTYKAAPALAAGNTIVVKPSDQTPVATLEWAQLFIEAGFPPGVLNVVTGGPACGAALSGHPDIQLIAFTGSDGVGRKVGGAAGEALSDVILELGGKSAQLVFADADLDAAVVGVLTGICVASGQSCIAGSRVFVEESIAEEFVDRLAARFSALQIGDPLDDETEIGPVLSRRQIEGMTEFVAAAAAEGATARVGGKPIQRDDLAGYYFEPTIFTGAENSMRFMRDEIFGPIVGIGTFRDEDEAVALANDSRFALAAGLWTSDASRTYRLAESLEAGTVWINTYRVVSYQSPFGGFKDSGVGTENGIEVMRAYTRAKSVWVDYSGEIRDPFGI